MIVKCSPQRSGHPGRLVNYLFGPGKAHEHRDHHTVAGSVHYPGAGPEIRTQVTADLQMPKLLWPQVDFTGGHIYHFSLAIGADEGQLPDSKWEQITHEYMQGMKLEDPTKAPVRWTAVRHGLSKEGNDHIHGVVNLIREDGTKVSVWQDQKRAQKVVAQIEQRHGLKVLQARLAPVGAGSVPYTEKEVKVAREGGRPVDRVELERHVRAAATAAPTEAQFVSLLRQSGVQVRPYPPRSGPVTGYSVALVGPDGQRLCRFYAGGELARDLTLPRIRGLWPDAGGSAGAALDQWRPDGSLQPAPPVKVLVGGAELEAAEQQLHGLDLDLALASPAEFVELSQDLAGAAAAAAAVAPPEQRVELARAAREVGGWAGTVRPVKRSGPARTQLVALALLHSLNPGSELSRAFMQRQLIMAIMQLVQSHRAARPVPTTPGRGGSMSQAQDDIDGVFGDALTTMTVTASVAAQRRATDRTTAVNASRKFLQRWRPEVDDHRLARDPVPAGFRGVIDPDDWAKLNSYERLSLDPDRIGRWITDIDPDRPETGPDLRSTGHQAEIAGRLGEELGEPGKGGEVAALTRAQAAKTIRRLEARLDPAALRDLYHREGLAYRVVDGDRVRFELPGGTQFPVPELPAQASQSNLGPAAAARGPERKGLPDDWLDQPLAWASANDPVQPRQAYTLRQHGVSEELIGKLNKGLASTVLTGFEKGELDGQYALDRALAAAERAAPLAQNRSTPHQGPTKNGPKQV